MQESGKASEEEALTVRLLTPVIKAYAGKVVSDYRLTKTVVYIMVMVMCFFQCVPLISEGIECFGGMGYMEDTGLPTILRDAQV